MLQKTDLTKTGPEIPKTWDLSGPATYGEWAVRARSEFLGLAVPLGTARPESQK